SKVLEACTDAIASNHLDDDAIDAFADYAPFSISQTVGRYLHAHGPNVMIPNACAAGNFAIGQALDYICSGEAEAVIAGGADAFSRYAYSGFARLGAIAPDVPRPFSVNRQGMVPGEGAAMLFLESLDSSLARGARIYAEVTGYGESCDAHHITQPDDGGIARAMHAALARAGLTPQAVSYVSVHGTGTPANDMVETRALRQVFGDAIPPLSSVKSMIGHAMGAASAIECVAAMMSMQEQFLTPTMNYLGPDEQCPVDCVPNAGRPGVLNVILKTASAFGGNNAAVVFQRFPRD
ncbi:MAG: beta-ketoacyl-[acyl-carrier-protein] synthase family protein, partial [Giesbergeria sp.]